MSIYRRICSENNKLVFHGLLIRKGKRLTSSGTITFWVNASATFRVKSCFYVNLRLKTTLCGIKQLMLM